MEKVISLRMYKKQGKKKLEKNIDFMKFNPISFLLFITALLIEIYLISKYGGSEPSTIYSIILFALGLVALIGLLWLNKGEILVREFPIKSLKDGVKYIIGLLILIASITIMMLIVRVSFKLAMENIDIYFYYIAAAIIEEAFFRMFLISLFISKIPNKLFGLIIGVLVSSLIFMLAHYSAYGQQVDLMLSMFLGGLTFSVFYIYFRDITITMWGHMIINLIVTYQQIGSILMQVS